MDPRVRRLRLLVRDVVGGDVWRLLSRTRRRIAASGIDPLLLVLSIFGIACLAAVALVVAFAEGRPGVHPRGVQIELQDPTPYVASRTRVVRNDVPTTPASTVQMELPEAGPLQAAGAPRQAGSPPTSAAKSERIAAKTKRIAAEPRGSTVSVAGRTEEPAASGPVEATPPVKEAPRDATAPAPKEPVAVPEPPAPAKREPEAPRTGADAAGPAPASGPDATAARRAAADVKRKSEAERLRDAVSTVRPM